MLTRFPIYDLCVLRSLGENSGRLVRVEASVQPLYLCRSLVRGLMDCSRRRGKSIYE